MHAMAVAYSGQIEEVQNLQEAVALCRRQALPGDIVLLAPACASFDMFENYEARGSRFGALAGGMD